jgi:hypothetical protein
MKSSVLGLIAALGFPSVASADCGEIATDAMQGKLGVSNGEPTYMEKITVGKRALLTNYHAWFRVDRCERGHVVVSMQRNCAMTDMWTSPNCEMDIGSMGATQ